MSLRIGRKIAAVLPLSVLIGVGLCVVIVFCVVNVIIPYYKSSAQKELSFDFKAQYLQFQRMNVFGNVKIGQDDPMVLEYLRNVHLTPPSDKGYNLTCDGMTYCGASMTQRKEVIRRYYEAAGLLRKSINHLLGNKRNGFFIECGANDGEFLSNSLYFEKELNWTGLLIEADPLPYAELKKKNRKAYISNTCLSTEPNPVMLKLERGNSQGLSKLGGAGGSKSKSKSKYGEFEAECFPLYSYLAALDIKVVDFVSLDIEGFERKVLKNFPFEKVLIKTIMVEANERDKTFDGLKALLESKNFSLYTPIKDDYYIIDYLYVNNAVLQKN